MDEVARQQVVLLDRYQVLERLGLDSDRLAFAVPKKHDVHLIPRELAREDIVERDPLPVPEQHGPIIPQRLPVHLEDDVVLLEQLGGVGQRPHLADQHPVLIRLHFEELPHLGVLHRLAADSECGKSDVVALVALHILQEVVDDRHRNDEADVLCTLQTLERHAYNLVVHDGRPPAVARVDRRIDLDGEEGRRAVHVLLRLHARHHPDAHADVVAACGISDDRDGVLQLRDPADLERRCALPEFLRVCCEEREIAFMPHRDNARCVLGRVAVFPDHYVRLVRDAMRVRKDAPPLNDEAAPRALPLLFRLPRHEPVRGRRDCEHLDHGVEACAQVRLRISYCLLHARRRESR
mmetsp:Transcript_42507/g.101157  ORF Transcript_42507/g.101157 Transcript_42507/m.101157 type:complete len:351 (-) Transcript_42507:209-1261(-)